MKAFQILNSVTEEANDLSKSETPMSAFLHAFIIIKDRWPEAEPLIATDPTWALQYAINVIKGRWPEGEAVIRKDPYSWELYTDWLFS